MPRTLDPVKGPKRDTHRVAARAARRSAEAPSSSPRQKRTPKEAADARIARRPASPPKPAPPVFDCAKCRKLAEAKADAARWYEAATKLKGEIEARNQAALSGVVVLSESDVREVIRKVYHPTFAEILAVPRDIALNPMAEDKDRLKAVQIIKDEVAGPVAQKLKLGADDGAVIQFVSGMPARGSAPPHDADERAGA